LGRPGYINLGHGADLGHTYDVAAMLQQTHAVLDSAWAGGVRYFDAARSYGRAEAFLGDWLRRQSIPPAEVTVASKWGYTYTADWRVDAPTHEVKEHSLPVLQRQWQESQQHLQPYLRVYQIHSATLESGVLENRAVLAQLAEHKRCGLLIGLSLSGPGQALTLTRAVEVTLDGLPLFDCVQATWNLLERSATAALQAAHAQGMAVIIKEALANGRLTDRNHDPGFARGRVLFTQVAERLGTTLDAVALAAVLAQPWVDLVLSGAATVAQLRANLAALTLPWDMTAETLLAELVEPPELYWRTRSQLPWN
jgi:aryl-alcohol dehydrogenase-like predicted oxidoreductase